MTRENIKEILMNSNLAKYAKLSGLSWEDVERLIDELIYDIFNS